MDRREMLEQRVEKDQLEHTENRERRASAPGIVQQMEEYSSKMEPGDKRGRIKMLQQMSEIHWKSCQVNIFILAVKQKIFKIGQ